MNCKNKTIIKVGKYIIYQENREVFIEKDHGEGMSIWNDAFEKFIDELWEKEF